jgi:predicted TIM-barrel enzyme
MSIESHLQAEKDGAYRGLKIFLTSGVETSAAAGVWDLTDGVLVVNVSAQDRTPRKVVSLDHVEFVKFRSAGDLS